MPRQPALGRWDSQCDELPWSSLRGTTSPLFPELPAELQIETGR